MLDHQAPDYWRAEQATAEREISEIFAAGDWEAQAEHLRQARERRDEAVRQLAYIAVQPWPPVDWEARV